MEEKECTFTLLLSILSLEPPVSMVSNVADSHVPASPTKSHFSVMQSTATDGGSGSLSGTMHCSQVLKVQNHCRIPTTKS